MAVLYRGSGPHGVFGASGQARTFDVQVGYVPFASNTGVTPVRFLEVFKSGAYADVSLHQWMVSRRICTSVQR
jgi:oxalate decarboxylase